MDFVFIFVCYELVIFRFKFCIYFIFKEINFNFKIIYFLFFIHNFLSEPIIL
jgi:hypothetical protein